MPAVMIVQTLDEKNKPYTPDTKFSEANSQRAIIIEKGLHSGGPSIMFDFQAADGTRIIAETTPQILESLLAAARGAKARWEVKRNAN